MENRSFNTFCGKVVIGKKKESQRAGKGEKVDTVEDFIFLDSKITVDSDCCYKIKRSLILQRKVMTELDSILKSRDITAKDGPHSQSYGFFPVVMYRCKSWTIKKADIKELTLLNCGVGEDS